MYVFTYPYLYLQTRYISQSTSRRLFFLFAIYLSLVCFLVFECKLILKIIWSIYNKKDTCIKQVIKTRFGDYALLWDLFLYFNLWRRYGGWNIIYEFINKMAIFYDIQTLLSRFTNSTFLSCNPCRIESKILAMFIKWMCMCVCMYTFVCIHLNVYIHMHSSIYKYIYTFKYVCIWDIYISNQYNVYLYTCLHIYRQFEETWELKRLIQ